MSIKGVYLKSMKSIKFACYPRKDMRAFFCYVYATEFLIYSAVFVPPGIKKIYQEVQAESPSNHVFQNCCAVKYFLDPSDQSHCPSLP